MIRVKVIIFLPKTYWNGKCKRCAAPTSSLPLNISTTSMSKLVVQQPQEGTLGWCNMTLLQRRMSLLNYWVWQLYPRTILVGTRPYGPSANPWFHVYTCTEVFPNISCGSKQNRGCETVTQSALFCGLKVQFKNNIHLNYENLRGLKRGVCLWNYDC